jgi:hypothetical protein
MFISNFQVKAIQLRSIAVPLKRGAWNFIQVIVGTQGMDFSR